MAFDMNGMPRIRGHPEQYGAVFGQCARIQIKAGPCHAVRCQAEHKHHRQQDAGHFFRFCTHSPMPLHLSRLGFTILQYSTSFF